MIFDLLLLPCFMLRKLLKKSPGEPRGCDRKQIIIHVSILEIQFSLGLKYLFFEKREKSIKYYLPHFYIQVVSQFSALCVGIKRSFLLKILF
jgi:hypothetical protein